MKRIPAKRLLEHSLVTGDNDLAARLILAASLEVIHDFQQHQPMTIPERLEAFSSWARGQPPLLPAPQTAQG